MTLLGLGFTGDRSAHSLDAVVEFVVDAINGWAQEDVVTLLSQTTPKEFWSAGFPGVEARALLRWTQRNGPQVTSWTMTITKSVRC